MVLTPHALIGAAIYTIVPNPLIGLPLAFLSHFPADWIPHKHYHANDPQTGNFALTFPNFLKVGTDFLIGIALCAIIAWRQGDLLFIAAGLLAMFPDAISFIDVLYEKVFSRKTALLVPFQKFHHWTHAKGEDPQTSIMFVQPIAAIGAFLAGFWRYS